MIIKYMIIMTFNKNKILLTSMKNLKTIIKQIKYIAHFNSYNI